VTSRSAAHVEDTRRSLLMAARSLFASKGFQATLTEEIVRAAGLTRGALYHHFRDKEDLFFAVFEEVSSEVEQSLVHRSSDTNGSGAWNLFRANSEVHLEAATKNAAYRQIVLIDGPAVLGWEAWSARRDGPFAKIAEYLRGAVEEGVLEPQPVEAMAHLLGAIGTGAVMYVAHAHDHGRARRDVEACNEQLLSGLLSPSGGEPSALRQTSRERPNSTTRRSTREGEH
jgi:AcrR family transcriptional regulator